MRERNYAADGMRYVSVEAMESVLDCLAREADLDGLVTTSSNAIAESIGWSGRSVRSAIARLQAEGKLSVLSGGRGNVVTEIQLAEDVFA